jgi:DNA-3-methyladenine glycosylase I
MTPRRCPWPQNPLAIRYHDREWGVPVRNDRRLFEALVLGGAQAGLSWNTILRKRPAYRAAFARFDPATVARYGRRDISRLLTDAGIVRNRLKIASAVTNAKAFITVQETFGSFHAYVWRFVDGRPRVNRWGTMSQIPVRSVESDALSLDLRQRGFSFVGTTICYAFMQAVGMVNDHVVGCFRYKEVLALSRDSEGGADRRGTVSRSLTG